MRLKVQILDSAMDDLRAGRRFYARQGGRDLGLRFLETLSETIGRLSDSGGMHARQFGFYRALAAKFPYSVYYDVEGDVVRVYAVVDNRRNPAWVEERVEGARAHTAAQKDRGAEGGGMCVREADTEEWGKAAKAAKGAKKKEKKLGWLDASCIRALLGIGPQDEASKLIREDARDWYYGDQGEYAWLASADVLREALAAKPDDSEDDCSYYRHWIPKGVKPVPVTNEARRLAKLILEEHRLPKDNEEDALDIAMAAAARAELFVSVNEANLANIRAYRKLAVTLCYRVHRWPRMATPGQLLMAEDLDPYVEEIHEFRDRDWKEWNGTLDGYFEHISEQGRQVREKYLAQCAACEAAGKAYCAEQARKRAAGVETMNHANRLEEVAE